MNDATIASQTAQSFNEQKDTEINNAKLFLSKVERDFQSPFEDTEPNAVPGIPEVRCCKMRCLLADKLVGLESDPVRAVTDIG